jgi:hypothetical protein
MELVSAYWEEMAESPDARSGRQTVNALRARAIANNAVPPAKNRLEQAIAILKDTTIEGGPYAMAEGPQGRINTGLKRYFAEDDPLSDPVDGWEAGVKRSENGI